MNNSITYTYKYNHDHKPVPKPGMMQRNASKKNVISFLITSILKKIVRIVGINASFQPHNDQIKHKGEKRQNKETSCSA